MTFRIIIPARYAASRLPGKLLLDIAGKPMLQHVFERAQSCGALSVSIATDNDNIFNVAKSFGADVYLTDTHHLSGTTRIAQLCQLLNYSDHEIVVNVQGDEPLIAPEAIVQVAHCLEQHGDVSMATLCEPFNSSEDFNNSNAVKVVIDKHQHALYFSRAPIPWHKNNSLDYCYRHIGLYAYRVGFLNQYAAWEPTPLEQLESLEQLRALWHGHRIYVAQANQLCHGGVDTEDDLNRVREFIKLKR